MLPRKKSTPAKAIRQKVAQIPRAIEVDAVVASLKRRASKRYRDGMARYAIPSDKAFGVPVGKIRDLGKRLGRNHELALALWETGWYECRMLTSFIDEPALVTPSQMDRWAKDFDNWAICDTVCFHLFDRTPHAFAKVMQWAAKREEFVKRAAFALLASLALHKPREIGISHELADEPFARCLPLIERAATDERNFVKKGVSWALRGIGRRSPALHAAAVAMAQRLAASTNATARWVGKDVRRDITRPAVKKRLAGRRRAAEG